MRPSSNTTGNSTCESPTVSDTVEGRNFGPVNSGMIVPAARMKKAVTTLSAISRIQNRVEAKRKASSFLPFCNRSVKTGTNAADSAALANNCATKLGTRKAIV